MLISTNFRNFPTLSTQALAPSSWIARPIQWIKEGGMLTRKHHHGRIRVRLIRPVEGSPFAIPTLNYEESIQPVQLMQDQSQTGGRRTPDSNESEVIAFNKDFLFSMHNEGSNWKEAREDIVKALIREMPITWISNSTPIVPEKRKAMRIRFEEWAKALSSWDREVSADMIEEAVYKSAPFVLIRELILNAMDAYAEAYIVGRIGVRVLWDGSFWVIEVSDDARGFPTYIRQMNNIDVDAISSGWSSLKVSGGLGLGLKLCEAVLTLRGGRLEIYSDPSATPKTIVRLIFPAEGVRVPYRWLLAARAFRVTPQPVGALESRLSSAA